MEQKIGAEGERECEVTTGPDGCQGEYDVFEDSDCTVPVRLDENNLIKFESDKTLFMK